MLPGDTGREGREGERGGCVNRTVRMSMGWQHEPLERHTLHPPFLIYLRVSSSLPSVMLVREHDTRDVLSTQMGDSVLQVNVTSISSPGNPSV